MTLYHVCIFTLEGAFKVGVDDTLLLYLLAHVVVHKLGVVLCPHACKGFPFSLGYAQSFKGILYVFGHIVPVALHIGIGAHICDDIVHIKPVNGGTPLGHGYLVVQLQGIQPELPHPVGITLFLGYLPYYILVETLFELVGVAVIVNYVVYASVNVGNLCLFLHIAPPFLLDKTLKAVFVDVIHQLCSAVLHDPAVHDNVGLVHLESLQYLCAVGDDEQCAPHFVDIILHTL